MIILKGNARDVKASVSNMRAEGKIPAVVYGPKFANTSIVLNYQEFVRMYNKSGSSTLITLDIDGKMVPVLVHDMDLHPVSNKVNHVDFYAVEAGKKVEASVPLEFVGESAAVKAGAQLVKVLHEIEVEALPENLPRFIEADLSLILTLEDTIHVKDLKLPSGVTTELDPEDVVASVVEYKEEVEQAPIDLTKIEVEKKGKVEEEGEVAAE